MVLLYMDSVFLNFKFYGLQGRKIIRPQTSQNGPWGKVHPNYFDYYSLTQQLVFICTIYLSLPFPCPLYTIILSFKMLLNLCKINQASYNLQNIKESRNIWFVAIFILRGLVMEKKTSPFNDKIILEKATVHQLTSVYQALNSSITWFSPLAF